MRVLGFKRLTRQRWDPENRTRVVLVAAIHEEDGTVTGEVWADVGGVATKIQTHAGAEVDAKRRVVTADGVQWTGPALGCSCNVPKPLRGLNPATRP